MALTDKLKAIGDAIRSKLGKIDLIPLSSMPDSIEDVYDKGVQDQYDLFWDTYQLKGTRRRYRGAFNNDEVNGKGRPFWTEETLRPKYSFGDVTNANFMFYQLNLKVNFMEYFSQYCPDFKFSLVNSTDNTNAFCLSSFTHLPSIDLRGGGGTKNENCLNNMPYLTEVESVVVDENTATYHILRDCPELVDVTIAGTLGWKDAPNQAQRTVSLHKSTKLSKDSIDSVIRALGNYTEGYYVLYLSLEAVNKAFETSIGANNGATSPDWIELCNSRPERWSISLT